MAWKFGRIIFQMNGLPNFDLPKIGSYIQMISARYELYNIGHQRKIWPKKIGKSLIQVLTCLLFDIRRIVPYFYVLVNSVFHKLGSRLGFVSGAPLLLAALAPTIACGMASPQPSAQAPSTHHGQCDPCLVWDQSTGGASGEYHHHQCKYAYFWMHAHYWFCC